MQRGLFTLSLNNLSLRMKNKRHAKAFQVSLFWKFVRVGVIFFILKQMSNKPMVFAPIWPKFAFEIE